MSASRDVLERIRSQIFDKEVELASLKELANRLDTYIAELEPQGEEFAKLSVDRILQAAAQAIQEAGKPLKAIDIIRAQIDPNYDTERDKKRLLENRVYSALKRSNSFTKTDGGFALRD